MKYKLLLYFFAASISLIACKEKKKYHDETKKEIAAIQNGALVAIIQFQQELNQKFEDPDTSPLPDKYRKDFESLDFFAPDTTYVVEARFVRTPEALPFTMSTTTGRKSEEVVYGIAYFTLNGKERKLELYQNKELMLDEGFEDYLFLPFTDLTNGKETYGGGRYIDLRIVDSETMIIDFNKAYNPYCVYNKKFSCPLVPSVNHLDTKVLAGLKVFDKNY